MLGEVISQNLAFILPRPMAVELVNNFHLSAAQWAKKRQTKRQADRGPIVRVRHTAQ